MKVSRVIIAVSLLALLLQITGCGSNQGLNGSLSVTATTTDAQGGTSVFVQATATYTNPDKTNLLRTPITFTISDGVTSQSETVYTNNSGSITIAFFVAKSTTAGTLLITAKTGDLPAFTTVTIAALPAPTTTATLTIAPPLPKTASFSALSSATTTTTFNLAKTAFVNFTSATSRVVTVTVFVNFTTTMGGGGPLTINGNPVANHFSFPLTTNSNGKADLLIPSTFVLSVPALPGSNVATITWTAFSLSPTVLASPQTTTLTATRNP